MENSVLLVRIYLPKIPRFSPREEKNLYFDNYTDSHILRSSSPSHAQPFTLCLSYSVIFCPFSLLHTGTYYSIFTFFLKLLTLKTIRKALFNSKTIKLMSPNNTQMICRCPCIYFPAMFFVLILNRSRNRERILTSKQYRIVNI